MSRAALTGTVAERIEGCCPSPLMGWLSAGGGAGWVVGCWASGSWGYCCECLEGCRQSWAYRLQTCPTNNTEALLSKLDLVGCCKLGLNHSRHFSTQNFCTNYKDSVTVSPYPSPSWVVSQAPAAVTFFPSASHQGFLPSDGPDLSAFSQQLLFLVLPQCTHLSSDPSCAITSRSLIPAVIAGARVCGGLK